MSQNDTAFFRANAGILVMDALGRVLAVERADIPGSWQLPQGGIDAGETPVQAAYRELQEETGLTPGEVELLGEVPGWLVYELPPEFRRKKTGWGQAQKWFCFRHLPAAKSGWKVGLLPEGGENRALGWKDLAALAETVPSFRKPVYLALLRHVGDGGRLLPGKSSGP